MFNGASDTLKAHIAMLVFTFLVSTSFTVGRAITFAMDPGALIFLRFLLAAAIFTGVAVLSKEKFKTPSINDSLKYFFLALLMVIFFVTMFEGLRWTTPLIAGAVFTTTPFMSAVIGIFVLGQRPGLIGFTCLLVAGLASIWIIFGGDLQAIMAMRLGQGELIFLIGCAAYSGYAPAVKKLHANGGLVFLTLWTLVAGTILLFIYGWSEIISTEWRLVSLQVYLGIGWLALFTTAITFYLIQYAVLRLSAIKVMSYTLLIPVFILLQRLANGGSWPTVSVLLALGVLIGALVVLLVRTDRVNKT